jgi:hypothetical protein
LVWSNDDLIVDHFEREYFTVLDSGYLVQGQASGEIVVQNLAAQKEKKYN